MPKRRCMWTPIKLSGRAFVEPQAPFSMLQASISPSEASPSLPCLQLERLEGHVGHTEGGGMHCQLVRQAVPVLGRHVVCGGRAGSAAMSPTQGVQKSAGLPSSLSRI